MERRLLTFIVASTAFFFVYITLRAKFGPPQEKQNPAVAEVPADDQTEVPAVDGEAGEPSEGSESDLTKPSVASDSLSDVAAQRPERPEWLTIGSMDPESGYYILVTLCSTGGGIERLELTERDSSGVLKYRRVDVNSGYLGYFAGSDLPDTDGVIVNVVGPGTPAAIAGMQVGDVIVGIDGKVVAMRDDLMKMMSETRPGQSIAVEVNRAGDQRTFKVDLTEHPLDLMRLARDGGPDQIQGNLSRLSCLMTLSKVNRKNIGETNLSLPGLTNPMELNWDSISKDAEASFTVELTQAEMEAVGGSALRIGRTYGLQKQSYALDMGFQVDNLSDAEQEIGVRLEGANGITLEGWWYSTRISPNWTGAAARDIVFKTKSAGHELVGGFELLKAARGEERPNANPALPRFGMTPLLFANDGNLDSREMSYVGVDSQYFTVAYVPPEGQSSLTSFERAGAGIASDPNSIIKHQERAVNPTFYLNTLSETLAPGKSMRQELRLFAGPKYPELLERFGLQECIYYGWFSAIAKVLGSLLHLFSGVGNYALAIILLTLVVRGCMFPLSR